MLMLMSCADNSDGRIPASENDVDAARNFIRSALDGAYKTASNYVVKDSMNSQLLDALEMNYQKNMDREEKRSYRESSIRIADVRKINDSTSIIVYSNSFKNKSDSLRVVRRDGTWLVDLKYTFLFKDNNP